VLLVENYRTLMQLHLVDTILAIALPYLGSAFGIVLLRLRAKFHACGDPVTRRRF
jgi:ABC-type glycerol-3-phosphate transport system permease component